MHWHILGPGSIGCLWAAHLNAAGHQTTLIVRNAQRLQTFPSQITLEQDHQTSQHPVQLELAESPSVIHNLLVTTKAYDVQPALEGVVDRLAPQANIVLLHNGMGPQQWATERFRTQRVWLATSTDGAWLRSPGHVVFAGQGETRIGRIDQPEDSSLIEALATMRLRTLHDNQIEQSLWRKLAINCAINPLTAVHQCRNGELVDNPDRLAEMTVICEEMDLLLQKLNLPLFDQGLLPVATQVAQATGANYSSMLQDVRQKRRTEIDYISGFACQQARKNALALNNTERLLNKLKKIC